MLTSFGFSISLFFQGNFRVVPKKIPEFIVPDLTGFEVSSSDLIPKICFIFISRNNSDEKYRFNSMCFLIKFL